MSEQINEQISALLDGELPEAELSQLLQQIDRKPDVLQQAQCLQQTRLCLQGDQPATSISQSLEFTSRIQNVIRNEQEFPSYDLSDNRILAAQLGVQADEQSYNRPEIDLEQSNIRPFGSSSIQNDTSVATVNNARISANDGKYRPLWGAGIAAAVAMVAVTAWQSQNTPSSIQSLQAPLQVNNSDLNIDNAQALNESDSLNSSYTVPEFSNLNVDQPFASLNELRKVNYSDYLLQNQVAPNSTSHNLSRLSEQFRATHTQQFFIDSRTGKVVMTIKPIEAK